MLVWSMIWRKALPVLAAEQRARLIDLLFDFLPNVPDSEVQDAWRLEIQRRET